MRRRIAGQHVLITGAASGIGKALALELARRGARLSLADIDGAGVRATAQSARAHRVDARAYDVDMADPQRVDELAARVPEEMGPVDVLVNNAGVAVVAPFLQTATADWDWIHAINVAGPIRLTRALLPSMLERRSGHLVMVASLAGLVGAPAMVAYSTTKFAMVGFAEALRLEVAEAGVDVTVVCPGYVRTNLSRATRYRNKNFQSFLDGSPSWYGMSAERVGSLVADALVTRAPLLVLGPEKLGWWLKRLAPEVAFAFSRWTARRAGIGVGSGLESPTQAERAAKRDGAAEAACTSP